MAPLVIAAAILALLLYANAFRRLRARGRRDLARPGRAALFACGIVVGVLAVVSPLDKAGDEYLLSAHMLQHVIIGDAVPALLVLGLAGPLALFVVPRPALRRMARGRLRRAASLALRPATALLVWAGAMAAWHVPAAYDYALAHDWAHQLEHACLFLGGLLVWFQIVDPARRSRLSAGQRAGYAAGVLVAGMALCEVLIASHPIYGAYARQPARPSSGSRPRLTRSGPDS
jgi:cytochrome c oxidase assembly factor CtaG